MTDTEKKPTVSIVLMVKNEEHNMEDFFRTIEGLADELVIVDTGSTDGTIKLAENLAKVAPFPVRLFHVHRESLHENATRQFGADQSQSEYIFELDADERLTEGFRAHLKKFLLEKKPLVVTIPRIDELVPHYIDIMDYRLFRKDGGAYYKGGPEVVHPFLYFDGKKTPFGEAVLHVQGKNHWLRRPNRIFFYSSREIDREENTRGLLRELMRGALGFFYKFRKVYFRLEARKDGIAGFKYAFLKGLDVFLVHLFIGLKPRPRNK